MSRPPLRPRRLLVIAAAASLSLAGLALPSPASAAPWSGTVTKSTTYNSSNAGCAAASPGTTVPSFPVPSNTPISLNISDSTTGTGPTAPDTATMSASVTGTAQINEAAGSVTDFDVTASVTAGVSRALGAASACTVLASGAVGMSGTFSVASAGLLDVDFSNLGSGSTSHTFAINRINPAPASGGLYFSINEFGRSHRLVSVLPGDYIISVTIAANAAGTSGSPIYAPTTDAKVKLHGVFRPFGVADEAATGLGSKYVTLGDGITCASHSVTADFTNKAGKKPKKGKKPVIKKATFYVNDAKVKSVKKPNKNTLVTLTGIPDDVVTVSAQLKLTNKGTVTVERTYLPCS